MYVKQESFGVSMDGLFYWYYEQYVFTILFKTTHN